MIERVAHWFKVVPEARGYKITKLAVIRSDADHVWVRYSNGKERKLRRETDFYQILPSFEEARDHLQYLYAQRAASAERIAEQARRVYRDAQALRPNHVTKVE